MKRFIIEINNDSDLLNLETELNKMGLKYRVEGNNNTENQNDLSENEITLIKTTSEVVQPNKIKR